MFVDTHAHLDMPSFDADREEVLRRAVDSGVEMIVTVACGSPAGDSVERSLDLADKHDFVFVGIGVHPHDARLAEESYWCKMESWARHPKILLWGEIGLDYYYDHSPRSVQGYVFRRQLQLAQTLALPVTIHCRDAWPDLLEILRHEWKPGNPGGIFHSFTGTEREAQEAVAMGFLISFSGMLTFKNAAGLRSVARNLALEKLLVETDSPYLAPVPLRGNRNEPAFVLEVARCLAQIKEVSLEEVAQRTTGNFRRLVGLPNS
jgi:TatD DNase family protein